jgi:hypothetical protein
MENIEFKEALKRVQSKKTRENYLVIKLSYDTKLIVPYKEGLPLVAALNNAELLNESYGKPKRITEFDKETVVIQLLSATEYDRIKVSALLNMDPNELKEIQEKEAMNFND